MGPAEQGDNHESQVLPDKSFSFRVGGHWCSANSKRFYLSQSQRWAVRPKTALGIRLWTGSSPTHRKYGTGISWLAECFQIDMLSPPPGTLHCITRMCVSVYKSVYILLGQQKNCCHREEGGKLSFWGDFSAAHGFLKKTQYIVQALELTVRKFPLPPEDSVEPTGKNLLSPPHVPSCLLFCLKPGAQAVSKLVWRLQTSRGTIHQAS